MRSSSNISGIAVIPGDRIPWLGFLVPISILCLIGLLLGFHISSLALLSAGLSALIIASESTEIRGNRARGIDEIDPIESLRKFFIYYDKHSSIARALLASSLLDLDDLGKMLLDGGAPEGYIRMSDEDGLLSRICNRLARTFSKNPSRSIIPRLIEYANDLEEIRRIRMRAERKISGMRKRALSSLIALSVSLGILLALQKSPLFSFLLGRREASWIFESYCLLVLLVSSYEVSMRSKISAPFSTSVAILLLMLVIARIFSRVIA